ncbi:unnamed protein product, partial [Amoebophrya sp. A25]
DVRASFPFEPYACQLEYMRKVVLACENRQNALLESPTGTGKTLCLLCGVLSWRETFAARTTAKIQQKQQEDASYHAWTDDQLAKDINNALPRIFYTSRTHSQLKQVSRELRKTAYRPRATVIGGREQLCVHPMKAEKFGQVMSVATGGSSGSSGGGGSGAGGTCSYYYSVFTRKYQQILPDTSLMDIEELKSVCKQSFVCPFFKSREDAREAQLVLCPYNYLLDPAARGALNLSLKNLWRL